MADRPLLRATVEDIEASVAIDKIVGDAIQALYAPGSPTRTTREVAALQFHRTPDEARADLGVDVRLRVGVNTGEVLVGSLRAGATTRRWATW